MTAEVVVDSSVWIEYFRRGDGPVFDALDTLLDGRRAILCGVVELEIHQGLRTQERAMVTDLFQALPYFETRRSDFIAAGELLGELRAQGVTIPSSDALVAAICLQRGVALLTLDRHFDRVPGLRRFAVGV
ncbi:MAG TPA: PIN domain-containing protein [bacterium]